MPNFSPLTKRVLEAVETHDATPAHFFRFASRRAAFGEEQVGVDPQTVGLVLPAAPVRVRVVPIACDPGLLLHLASCRMAPSSWERVSRSCNYTDVILHYHKWFAQGGISKCRLAGMTRVACRGRHDDPNGCGETRTERGGNADVGGYGWARDSGAASSSALAERSSPSRASHDSSALVSRRVSPVAKRSITKPVNVALISDACKRGALRLQTFRHQALLDIVSPHADLVGTHIAGKAGDGRLERRGLVVEPHQREVLRRRAQPLPPSPVQLDLRQLR